MEATSTAEFLIAKQNQICQFIHPQINFPFRGLRVQFCAYSINARSVVANSFITSKFTSLPSPILAEGRRYLSC